MAIRLKGDVGELALTVTRRAPTKANGEPDLWLELEASNELFMLKGTRVWVEWADVNGFLTELVALNKTLVGTATLSADSPEDFGMAVRSLDSRGHLAVEYKVGRANGAENGMLRSSVASGFEISPREINDLIAWLERAIAGESNA
jgi:hypothetical protein